MKAWTLRPLQAFIRELPDKVNAVFAGGLTMELEVVWDKLTLEQYSREGEFTVEGRVSGLKEKCAATVRVIGDLGDGKTVKETGAAKDAFTQERMATPLTESLLECDKGQDGQQ